MDGDTVHVFIAHLDLTGVQAGTNLQAEISDGVADRTRAVDGPRWAVECREHTIASGLHDDPACRR